MKKILFLLSFIFLFQTIVESSPPSSSYTFLTGQTIQPNEVQQETTNIYNYLTQGVDTFADGSIVNADISGSAGITYGKLSLGSSILSSDIKDGEIVNADISSSAAIGYSKLSLGSSLLTGDIKDGEIVNADISSSAAIVASKLTLTGITTLTAGGNLDIGSYDLKAQTLTSDITTGTAPLTIASTTKVTNLNADTIDGIDGTYLSSHQLFTSSGTFTAPAGVTKVYVTLCGGGGNGATGPGAQGGGGGGSSAYAVKIPIPVTATSNYTVTVGGATASSGFTGDSSIGVSVNGGSSGSSNSGGAAGTVNSGVSMITNAGRSGSNSGNGTGGGGAGSMGGIGGAGGTAGQVGVAGSGYGSGGGGGGSSAAGGAGAAGFCLVEW